MYQNLDRIEDTQKMLGFHIQNLNRYKNLELMSKSLIQCKEIYFRKKISLIHINFVLLYLFAVDLKIELR